MHISINLVVSLLIFLVGMTNAGPGWRTECNFGGNAMFNILQGVPYLSTYCPDHTGRQICTMLDLNYCLMNSNGHLIRTIGGNFLNSCKDCHLIGRHNTFLSCNCQMFGKDSPWQNTQIDLENVVTNRDGRFACWDSKPMVCPGFDSYINES
ncbi:hypothetical protein SAMD00023353_6300500 [Rosellinia necatrix]|uniref:Cyanovirin-N domain-containing protein n=1 Tax=Rosellinia necatrix TaxID=77044 RepID=A0A1W2TSA2_ROSNE|nr:hypothetical protein SAMD00023353_6300500 [Rosellinia necatrix]